MISVVLLFLVLLGAVSAVDISASNTEDSNLTNDNVNTLSQEKLEVSSDDSISKTNIVNSHDDNLNDYPEDSVLRSCSESYYEDNGDQKLGLANDDIVNTVSVSSENIALGSYVGNSPLTTSSKVSTTLNISNTHYDSSATQFRVILQDKNGNNLANKKITLKVNNKVYSGATNKNGAVYIKTSPLAIGSYTISVSFAGDSNYSSSSLSKKVRVLSSVKGKDLTKYYSDSNYYSATFWQSTAYLTNAKVTFNIDGTKYTFTTNSKGVAVAKVNLKPGKHVVSVTNPATKEKITNNILVKKDTSTIKGNSKVIIKEKQVRFFTDLFYKYFHLLNTSQPTTSIPLSLARCKRSPLLRILYSKSLFCHSLV